MKVRGTKIRLDLYAGQPRAISTIKDLNTGDIVTLMHNQKMFLKTPGAPTKQARPASTGAAANVKPPKPRDTGKSEKMGGYDTKIYTWSNSRGIIGTAWVAKNFPNFAQIRTDLAALDKSPSGTNNDMSPELSTLPGMVVKSQVSGGGQTITAILVSAKEEPIDASLFQTPRDYREVPRPQPLKPVSQPPPKTANQPPPKKVPGKK